MGFVFFAIICWALFFLVLFVDKRYENKRNLLVEKSLRDKGMTPTENLLLRAADNYGLFLSNYVRKIDSTAYEGGGCPFQVSFMYMGRNFSPSFSGVKISIFSKWDFADGARFEINSFIDKKRFKLQSIDIPDAANQRFKDKFLIRGAGEVVHACSDEKLMDMLLDLYPVTLEVFPEGIVLYKDLDELNVSQLESFLKSGKKIVDQLIINRIQNPIN